MKKHPHRPTKTRTFHWLVCMRCGLVYLRNERTQKAINKSCPAGEE